MVRWQLTLLSNGLLMVFLAACATPTPTPTVTPSPTPEPTPAPRAVPTPTPTATLVPAATPTPNFALAPTPLALDFTPIVASEGAWDCFASREIPPSFGGTACGWHRQFEDNGKRPPVTYYIREGDDAWAPSRQSALALVLSEIGDLTGLGFKYDKEQRADVLKVYLVSSPNMAHVCTDDGVDWTIVHACAKWHEGPYPGSPRVYVDREAFEDDDLAFKGTLRHELLHALFGFHHALRPPSVLEDYGHPYDFTDRDREMLRLYGAIPRGLSWDEIQRRACVGEGGICVELYEWRDEPWWKWDTAS